MPSVADDNRWNRFTLLDAALLIAACAIGFALETNSMQTEGQAQESHSRAAWAIESAVLSCVVASPLILGAQWFRGRRAKLSLGEWLWLTPLMVATSFFALSLVLGVVRPPVLVPLIIPFSAVWFECLLSLVAFGRLVNGVSGYKPDVSCRWTDTVGCAVCMSVGPAVAFAMNEALSRL
jgi:hypothetical protein